jgi:hypothetical protein
VGKEEAHKVELLDPYGKTEIRDPIGSNDETYLESNSLID